MERAMRSVPVWRPGFRRRSRPEPHRGTGSATRREDEPSSWSGALGAARRLAGELDQGLEDSRLLLGAEDQEAVIPLRRLLETGWAAGLDSHLPARREVEVAPIAEHGVKHTGKVPGRPVVRRRDVSDVSLGQRVVRDVMEVALDA